MFDPKHLTNAQKEDVESVLAHCNEMRSVNRLHTRGWTQDRTMRASAKFPIFFVYDKELKKYFNCSDPHERNKDMARLESMLKNKYGWDFTVNG